MDYLNINKSAWDERTKAHLTSEFYDVEGFIAGKSSLNDIELRLLGDVSDKSLLHLQCHFGLDTLSLARLGADVTGVDLSSEAIGTAIQLAEQTKLKAKFVCQDIYQFGDDVKPEYDLVYTSYGVLCWLPDLKRWAETIKNALKPGGRLVLVEFHPFVDFLSGYRYFFHTDPDIEVEGSYTENSDHIQHKTACWAHPVSTVFEALQSQGFQIESFKEYPYSPYNCFDGLVENGPGKYVLARYEHPAPMVYAITATKVK